MKKFIFISVFILLILFELYSYKRKKIIKIMNNFLINIPSDSKINSFNSITETLNDIFIINQDNYIHKYNIRLKKLKIFNYGKKLICDFYLPFRKVFPVLGNDSIVYCNGYLFINNKKYFIYLYRCEKNGGLCFHYYDRNHEKYAYFISFGRNFSKRYPEFKTSITINKYKNIDGFMESPLLDYKVIYFE